MGSWSGGCLCGDVRFNAAAAPDDIHYCHCTRCRKAHGGGFSVRARFPVEAVTWAGAAPKLFRSSPIAERGHCRRCGTPLLFRYLDSRHVFLSVAAFDDVASVEPRNHWCTCDRLNWLAIVDDLPRHRDCDSADRRAALSAHGLSALPPTPRPSKGNGGCLCGDIRFETLADPEDAQFCHCRMCQKSHGNPFAVMASFVMDEELRFLKGDPKIYKSSSFARRGFCDRCGSPISFAYDNEPGVVAICLGAVDDPNRWPPRAHWGVEAQVPWLVMGDGLPRRRTEDDPVFQAAQSAAGKG